MKYITTTNDRLAHMLNEQGQMQTDVFGFDFTKMTTNERVNYIKDNVLALTDELHELLAETSWKPWAKSVFINEEKAVGELVDAWHFMMNILIALTPQMSANDVAELFTRAYDAKHKINVKRQEDGYDGQSTKCPGCKRALDDISAVEPGLSVDNGKHIAIAMCVGCGTDVTDIYIKMTQKE